MTGPNSVADPNQPTLFVCHQCGHQMLIPFAMLDVVAGHHQSACLGPAVRRILELLEPPAKQDA